MTDAIIVAAISPLISAAAAIIVGAISNAKTKALIEYKLEELTKKVDKHNNVIERTYKLEEMMTLQEEKIKVLCKELDEVKHV